MQNLLDLPDSEIYYLVQTKQINEEEFLNWLSERLDETWQKAIDLSESDNAD